MKRTARLERLTAALSKRGRRVFIRNAEDTGWLEYVSGRAIIRTDAEVQAAENAGYDCHCIIVRHVDDWRHD